MRTNHTEAAARWRADRPHLERLGITLPLVTTYRPPEWCHDYGMAFDAVVARHHGQIGHNSMAFDAQPGLATDPTAGIPVILTTSIDPEVTRILFTPNKAAEIFGEKRAGTWLDNTRLFPVVEHTGEVASYGDFDTSGRTGVNADWPNRQAYLFQIIKEYGVRELELAGLAKLNWVSELDQSAATIMSKFLNFTYFFGVLNLQNYGLLNDPGLPASLTPALKAYGGTRWIVNGVVQATANEVYTDIQSTFIQLINQSNGLVDAETKLVLALSPQSEQGLTATNTFNVNVHDLLKKNFPNIRVETAIQYGVTNASNPQGLAAGQFMQLIAEEIDGQDTGYCAFNEKMRSFPVIPDMSSFKQKVAGGTWGAIIRQQFAVASMLGL